MHRRWFVEGEQGYRSLLVRVSLEKYLKVRTVRPSRECPLITFSDLSPIDLLIITSYRKRTFLQKTPSSSATH